jgi:hypothetical protein
MAEPVVFLPLSKGHVTVIDFADLEKVRGHKWCVVGTKTHKYAQSRIKNKAFNLHRFLMGNPTGKIVDHIDGNGLNNCRANLRIVSARQNTQNSFKSRGCSSKYKGVAWNKRDQKWEVKFTFSLGQFESEEDAAKKYDDYVRSIHGEFARYNFPKNGEQSGVRK